MPAKEQNSSQTDYATQHFQRRLKEVLFIVLIAIGLFCFLAFITYNKHDPGFFNTGTNKDIANMGGLVGSWLADIMLYVFGYVAYLLPLSFAYSGWLLLKGRDAEQTLTDQQLLWLRGAGLIMTLLSACGLFALHMATNKNFLPFNAGGIIGDVVGHGLVHIVNAVGANLLFLALLLSGITMFTGLSWLKLAKLTGLLCVLAGKFIQTRTRQLWQKWQDKRAAAREVEPEILVKKKTPLPAIEDDEFEVTPIKIVKPEKKQLPVAVPKTPAVEEKPVQQSTSFEGSELDSLPPLSLLEEAQHSSDKGYTEEVLERLSRLVEEKLEEFGIRVNVVAVYPGPVITRFELELAPGVKVSKLTSLSKDIARSLSFTSVRIVEIIAGKSYVGLEIPNQHREMVRLSEVLSSQQYADSASALTLGLGVDISGKPVVTNLAKMPHLLVAGTTGSGKSVGLNAMLLSLLYKSTPDQVRLIMVDPKMLELAVYDGIPHLLTPVITDMKHAANALRWSIGEMERRYKLMSMLGVRNLAGYNDKIKAAKKAGEPLRDPMYESLNGELPPELEVLPFIVILVDEFADMMMVVGKKVDELIARLAQKARAAGLHLILATQRPSVDVITGLIKANVPTRIAFQVSSRVDSRTILDQLGAEQLLGHGDMLYQEAGMSQPVRVHGAFVADEEVHKVVEDLKAKGKPVYLDEVTQGGDTGTPRADVPGLNLGEEGGNGDHDELFDQAVEIVAKTRRASISNVQRRLKIGYNRAARILEQMEEEGMVTSMEGNGTREVLLPPVEE